MNETLFQKIKDPKGLRVAVLGAGVSGKCAAKLLKNLAANVAVFDSNAANIKDGDLNIEPLWESLPLDHFDFIVLSPGIPRAKSPVKEAIKKGVPVINELDLAYPHLKDCKLIGVTGTNGKSTTTAMIGEVLKRYNEATFIGGNYGRPLCDAVINQENPKIGVVELSSYQLESLIFLRLDVAVVTNLSPDHLDRYIDVEEYYCSKNKIFTLLKKGGFSIINQKDENSCQYLEPLENVIEFNHLLPFKLENVVGAHNIENAAAAFEATRAIGMDVEQISDALGPFAGIAHRLEFLGSKKGVRWFNDSKATNVDSAVVAVNSFADGIHLIVGGRGKGASYQPLVNACRGRVKGIYAIGEDATLIQSAFSGQSQVFNCDSLENAVLRATQNSAAGDVILLAPACASFDQYPNYAARGDHFRELFRQEHPAHE